MSANALPPGPKGHPVYGMLREYRRDALGLFLAATTTHGDVVSMRIGRRRIYIVNHVDHVTQVLVANAANYGRSPSYGQLALALGTGLLTSEGQVWRQQRNLCMPAFRRSALAAMSDGIGLTVCRSLERLDRAAGTKQAVDVFAEMLRVSMAVSAKALFGFEVEPQSEPLMHAIQGVIDYLVGRLEGFVKAPAFIPTPARARFLRQMRVLEMLVAAMIAERRTQNDAAKDILDRLLLAKDEDTGARLTNSNLRDHMLTFFLTSHETTAVAVTWALHLLALHPGYLTRLKAEMQFLRGRAPRLADLDRLPLTIAVLKETMRLQPPVWSFSRTALTHDLIGGWNIPKGAMVVVSPYCLHRHGAFWTEPEAFRPERFLADADSPPPGAYIPFGFGPRSCIGSNFALMIMPVLLAVLLQRWRFECVPDRPVQVKAGITIRPRNGLWMRLIPDLPALAA